MSKRLRLLWSLACQQAGVPLSLLEERAEAPVDPVEASGVEPPKGEIWAYGPLVTTSTASWMREEGIACFTAPDFKAALAESGGEVLVRINSPGGIVSEASTIQVAIREYTDEGGTVNAIIEGMAHSAASLITLGMNGHIRIAELAETMVHLPWGIVMGNSKAMTKAATRLLALEDRTVDMYTRKAKVGRDEMRRLLEEETFLTAGEAVRVGLADEVVEPVARPKKKGDGDGTRMQAGPGGPAMEPRLQAATTAAFL